MRFMNSFHNQEPQVPSADQADPYFRSSVPRHIRDPLTEPTVLEVQWHLFLYLSPSVCLSFGAMHKQNENSRNKAQSPTTLMIWVLLILDFQSPVWRENTSLLSNPVVSDILLWQTCNFINVFLTLYNILSCMHIYIHIWL